MHFSRILYFRSDIFSTEFCLIIDTFSDTIENFAGTRTLFNRSGVLRGKANGHHPCSIFPNQYFIDFGKWNHRGKTRAARKPLPPAHLPCSSVSKSGTSSNSANCSSVMRPNLCRALSVSSSSSLSPGSRCLRMSVSFYIRPVRLPVLQMHIRLISSNVKPLMSQLSFRAPFWGTLHRFAYGTVRFSV